MHDLWDDNSNFVNSLSFVDEKNKNALLTFLYQNKVGRFFLRIAISKPITKAMGHYYDSKYSKKKINKFIEKNEIEMKKFKKKKYSSFNDFFTREKKQIEFSQDENFFCSPCDAYLSAYKVEENSKFKIKEIEYSLEELLQNYSLSKMFQGGVMYVFRLTPRDYHRYHYFDEGVFLFKKIIPGAFHTVRSVALEKKKVFIENQREYSLLKTKNFEEVLFMEVGALGVGKIKNHDKKKFKRGEEKGMFLFGGSTVIVLFKKDILKSDHKLIQFSKENLEAIVECGCIVGEKR